MSIATDNLRTAAELVIGEHGQLGLERDRLAARVKELEGSPDEPLPTPDEVVVRVGQPLFVRPGPDAGGPGVLPFGFARFETAGMRPLEGKVGAFAWSTTGDRTVGVTSGPDVRVRVVSDDRPVVRTSGDNLEALWVSARPNTVIEVAGSGTQTVRSPAVLRAANVTLRRAADAGRPVVKVLAGANQYFGLVSEADGTTVEGLAFDTDYARSDKAGCPAFGIRFAKGGGLVRDCLFDNVETGVKVEHGNAPVLVLDCESTSRTRGYGVLGHGGKDVVVCGGIWRSINEHPIRLMSWQGLTATNDGWTIAHQRCERTATATKEALTIRSGRNVSVHDFELAGGFGLRIGIAGGDEQLPSPRCERIMLRRGRFVRNALWLYGGTGDGNGIDGLDYDGLAFERPGYVQDSGGARTWVPKPAVNGSGPNIINVRRGSVEVK